VAEANGAMSCAACRPHAYGCAATCRVARAAERRAKEPVCGCVPALDFSVYAMCV
jgi:hypothetical protein